MENEWLIERFEADRPRLRSVAFRLLGSASEADDAVQEAWLRLTRADAGQVENLGGWLTTVVSRVCLDMLRSRRARREEPLGDGGPAEAIPDAASPEREAILAESVGAAMAAVVQQLAPAERVAFVLHDVFGVSFEEIAEIVGRSPAAARQLASRARRRVQGASAEQPGPAAPHHREVVEAFFRASRSGDFEALLAVLAPDVVLKPDEAALRMGARTGWLTSELRGARTVAGQFAGRAQAAQLALIDGKAGAVWAAGGRTVVAFVFEVREGRVTEVELVADPERLNALEIVMLA